MKHIGYILMSIISVYVRSQILPNPFDSLTNIGGFALPETILPFLALFINLMVEPLIHKITFAITGVYYEKGYHLPIWGSFLYLVFYSVHIAILCLMSFFSFHTTAVVLILIAYIGILIGLHKLQESLSIGRITGFR